MKHTLILTHPVFHKITEYVRLIDAEIGMFGYVTSTPDGFVVDDVFLVRQTVSGSSVDFSDSGLEYAIDKAIKDDRINDLLFCCHSHVNMGAFWSTTDEDMIAGMNNGMTPYLVSLVINKKGETEQRVDFFNPTGPLGDFTTQVRYDLDLMVEQDDDPVIAQEIAELVTHERRWSSRARPRSQWTNGSRQKEARDLTIPVTNAAGDITGWLDESDLPTLSDADLKALGLEDAYGYDLAHPTLLDHHIDELYGTPTRSTSNSKESS